MAAKIVIDSTFQHWGGGAFALGNLLFLMNKVNEMARLFLGIRIADLISGQNIVLILIGQVALIVGFVALYQFYSLRVDRLGKYALRLFCGGGIILAIGHVSFMSILPSEFLFILVILGLFLLLIGLLLLGIISLRQPILGHNSWLPLATALAGMIGFFLFSGTEITAIFLAFRTLFALGLMGIGVLLWIDTSEPIHRALVNR